MLSMRSCAAPLAVVGVAAADDMKVAIREVAGSPVKDVIGAVFA